MNSNGTGLTFRLREEYEYHNKAERIQADKQNIELRRGVIQPNRRDLREKDVERPVAAGRD